ncbi:MAG: pseudouridine synthase [bacterium]|nr:pseudouridine synthase [bacterium]MDZ4247875.1 pseudouridine synthase [Patescibacteria group bacterium]
MTRLGKLIAIAGMASRRRAVELVKVGKVRVGGRVEKDPAVDVPPDASVTVDGRTLRREPLRHYLLHKPVGTVSTAADTHGRRTVTDLVPKGARVYPVGRLDADSSGLILLTNDGDLTNKLTHPRHEVPKTYRVTFEGALSEKTLDRLRRGVRLRETKGHVVTKPADVRVVRSGRGSTTAELTIREGRNRQIRRMGEAVGHAVTNLVRIRMGPLSLGRLPKGKYRPLERRELDALRKL